MARVLVCYATSEGQTATIAERIGDVLATDGHDTDLVHAKHPPSGLDPGEYDGVVVGASIHMGSHQTAIDQFVRDHRTTLNRCPSAFFSVSLTAAHPDPADREPVREILEDFLEETGWDPDTTLLVGGALKYSEYGLLKRFLMRRVVGKEGGDTDTSRDYEYTDWEEVEAFAHDFATLL
ncbi:flavodoxin domain-containing protein [Natronolimnohabitans sp. A-GB9]|uniref:flavodoxin domain-containing protein n=1 Tax=Natronolimnohabitans sp. A-GB9 TaxID=3069757 RepID=UPI0027AEED30|nr:flavodoxin domain-containing protein [Natronolimnohabitans sp. A-GB9]MDQ2051012.1 flavodoxin domain-containing protein [Natronolimnohabitans sp. A-GB9]